MVPIARSLLLSASKKGVPIDWSGKDRIAIAWCLSRLTPSLDFAGRIAITLFTRSHMDYRNDVLDGDIACLDRDDPLRDALAVLNRTSAKYAVSYHGRQSQLLTRILSDVSSAPCGSGLRL